MVTTLESHQLIIKPGPEISSGQVRDYIEEARQRIASTLSYHGLVIDMSEVENIDSLGISFIVGLYKTAAEKEKSFKVVGLNRRLEQLFRMLKLNEVFPVESLQPESMQEGKSIATE